jgi:D-glycero-D-manno-heptose 1,7-bisphosphate phosphatase
MTRGGIFLDRDGTINKEVEFLAEPGELELIPGAAAAIRDAHALGFKVFIVTNQSGIARGLLTEQQLTIVHTRLLSMLLAEGASIDSVYYCPHHPEGRNEAYRKVCSCRKPATGMVDQAVKEFGVDPKESYVIGDRMADIQLAHNIGATSILVLTGYGAAELGLCRASNVPIDHVAKNLSSAMQFVATRTTQSSTSPSPHR